MILSDELIQRLDLGASFVPPFPHRPAKRYSIWKLCLIFRKNIIGVFHQNDFKTRFSHQRVLKTDIYLCNDPDGVRATLTQQHPAFERKTPQQRHALEPLLGDGLFISDGETWRERRAIVAPIVHGSRVRTFAPAMSETVQDWRKHWLAAGPGAKVDVLAEMGQLTAEIISRSIFGRRLGRDHTAEIVAGFAEYQRRIDQFDLASVIGLPDSFPRLRGIRTRRALKRVHRVIDDVIDRFEEQRAQGKADSSAVIGHLFAGKDHTGQPMSRAAIRNEAIVIFMAGHETTANTLAWALYLVSQSDRVRNALHAEIDSVLGDRPPEFDDLPNLVFTRAIIEETLRLYPPVPLLARTATADGWFGKRLIRKGATLLVAPWLLHRNTDIWSLPDHFVPERFDPRLAPRPDKHVYVPFAVGPRVCPGLTFGLTEATLCLATLCQAFEMTLEAGHRVEVECRLTLRPGTALPMRLRPRLH